MTKSTITRERAQQIFLGNGPEQSASEERELARMALAAMDSEPVAYIDKQWTLVYYVPPMSMGLKIGDKLYRHAQPAPVVPNGLRLALSNAGIAAPESDEMLAATCEKHIQALVTWVKDRKPFQSAPVVPSFEEWLSAANRKPLGWVKDAMREASDACRAAMLQAGTLTNEGTKQAWTGIPDIDNAINMLDRIDTLDSCDDDRIEAVKTVLRRLAGNSPVIPDGYVMVPKEMTDEIGEAIAMQANCCGGIALDIYDAMIAAAPHDTPALNSVQSVVTVPGKLIPVSEQKPDCWCLTCRPVVLNDMRFVVCPDCGNKRCPRANDHRNACTRSNEPGQEGSAYPAAPQEVRGE
ncbi:TPA: hypothetical protein ACNG72_004502 [Klebsiella pneumoniae]